MGLLHRALLTLAVVVVALPARADTQTQAERAKVCKTLVGFSISGRSTLDIQCSKPTEGWSLPIDTVPAGTIRYQTLTTGDLLERRDDYWTKELPKDYDEYKKKKVISETKTASVWVQRFNTFLGESIVTATLVRMPDGAAGVRIIQVTEKKRSGLLKRFKVDIPKQDVITPDEVNAWVAVPHREELAKVLRAPNRDITYSILMSPRATDTVAGYPGSGTSHQDHFVSSTWLGKDAGLEVLTRRAKDFVRKDKVVAARDELVAEAIKDVPNISKRERLSGTATPSLFTERWKLSDSTGAVKIQFVVLGAYLRDDTTSAEPLGAIPFTVAAWCREDAMPLDSCTRMLDSLAIFTRTFDPTTIPGPTYASSSGSTSSPPSSTSPTPSTPSSPVYAFAEDFFKLGLREFRTHKGTSCDMLDSSHPVSVSMIMTEPKSNYAFFAISDGDLDGVVILAPSGKQLKMTQFGSSELAAGVGMNIIHVAGIAQEQKVARIDISTSSSSPHKVCIDVLYGKR